MSTDTRVEPVPGTGDATWDAGETVGIRGRDTICEGDTYIVHDVHPLAARSEFATLKNEIQWQKMYHASGEVPRLVCCQGSRNLDGSMPVYRHPSDQSLPLLNFSPTVESMRVKVEAIVQHPMNHVLIQLYRSGEDFISEHSDKTLDIVRWSSIANVSLGAQRKMRLRTKKSGASDDVRQTEIVPLPSGSVFVLGPRTNMGWLHSIRHDKRAPAERSYAETAFDGERISLTFRHIGTFLNSDSSRIWGQGGTAKTKEHAQASINGDNQKTKELLYAFGSENQQSVLDWDATYGTGFDVLHFHSTNPSNRPMLFLSGVERHDLAVRICLEELKVVYNVGGVKALEVGFNYEPEVMFRDFPTVENGYLEINSFMPVLLFLLSSRERQDDARTIASRRKNLQILEKRTLSDQDMETLLVEIQTLLSVESDYLPDGFSSLDMVFWPVAKEAVESWPGWDEARFGPVKSYYERVAMRESIASCCRPSKSV